MAKRVILASSGVAFFVCIGLIIFAFSAAALTIDPAQIESGKNNVIAFIDAGDYTQAESAADKLLSDYRSSPDTAAALHQIAQRFEQKAQYRQSLKYSQLVVANWPQFESAMWSQMGVVISNVALGNDTDARTATDGLIARCGGNKDLAWALCIIADNYGWRRQYDNAGATYRMIIEKCGDSSYANKARLGVARVNVLSLIEQGSYSLAEQELDLLIADFNPSPDLPDTLYAVGERFGWTRRYVEAKDIFDRVIADYPQSSVVDNASFYAARMNACALISAGKDAEAVAAIDRFIADHNDNPQLADALYWITQEYEWTKGTVEDRTTRYDTPTTLYGRLMQQFGDSSLGRKAAMDQKRLSHRTKIFTLMGSAEQNDIDTAIAAMVAEFNGQPALVSELYWCGREYEEYPAKYPQSKAMYERIITEFPKSVEANQARLDVRRMDIHILIEEGDYETAEVAIEAFVGDFNEHSYAGESLRRVARQYYETGLSSPTLDKPNIARAIGAWQRIIDRLPVSFPSTAAANYFIGDAYDVLGQCRTGIPYLERVVTQWPDYQYARRAESLLVRCRDKVR